jgi:hypothetical protein
VAKERREESEDINDRYDHMKGPGRRRKSYATVAYVLIPGFPKASKISMSLHVG